MKWQTFSVTIFSLVLSALPAELLNAQPVGKKSLPPVPITYQGDTEKAILRRAQWVEGARKEGTLSWWGSANPNQINQIVAAFNKIYPFITVHYWRGQDTERITRLETGQNLGRLEVDITEGGETTNLVRWRKMGIPEQYTDMIPGIEKWDKRNYGRQGDWAQPEHTPMVIMYNTKLVAPAQAPKRWEDLLDPKWKGKIGLTADMKAWYLLALDEKGWGIEKTEDFLRRLKQQQLIWTQGHAAGHNLLVSGEFAIMGEDYLRYIFESKEKGAPVEWCKVNPVPNPGSYYLLPKKAPHPNAARLFFEWYMSPQGLAMIETVMGKGAVFPGAESRQARLLEGVHLIYKTEEIVLKAHELGLVEKFANILGVQPE